MKSIATGPLRLGPWKSCRQWGTCSSPTGTLLMPAVASTHLTTPRIGESLRGNRIGATGLRASERKISASERVSERSLWEGDFQSFFRDLKRFLEVLRGFRGFQSFSEVFRDFSEGFQRSSQRPSQRQISFSEALSLVAPIRVAPWTFSNYHPSWSVQSITMHNKTISDRLISETGIGGGSKRTER